jgi:hypothetical protein
MTGSTGDAGSSLLTLLIGFACGAGALLAKEYVAPVFHDWRSKKLRQREIYRYYVAPLSLCCIRLLWRCKEVFVDDRYHFLLTSSHPLDYNEYKRTSTLYRIASLMGWIRAIDLELSALPQRTIGESNPLVDEIARFQSALADGPHVEAFRLEHVCRLWNLPLAQLDEDRKAMLAMKFEVELYRLAGDDLKSDKAFLRDMADAERVDLCRGLATFLAAQFKLKVPDEAVIAETSSRAALSLSYREAWIYRDWQEAIGDSVIEKDEVSPRRYKVIGFRSFESVLSRPDKWMKALAYMIEDVDLERPHGSDFRGDQLRQVARSVAKIVQAIANSSSGDLVDGASRQLADQLAALPDR